MIDPQSQLARYATSGRRKVQGWFSRIDAELFSALLLHQNATGARGATAEIGVHHGSSFIPLCLALKADERALCIDLFEDQVHNIDRSGQGDRAILLRNLAAARVDLARVEIMQGSSLDLTPGTILDKVGPVRFFSVDGGHWHAIVKNDLEIALATGTEDLVIALDDILHKEWPEVTSGFLEWFASRAGMLAPIALSDGKLYLARKAKAAHYSAMLAAMPFCNFHLHKHVDLLGCKVPLIKGSGKRMLHRANDYIRLYHPHAFSVLRKAKRTLSA